MSNETSTPSPLTLAAYAALAVAVSLRDGSYAIEALVLALLALGLSAAQVVALGRGRTPSWQATWALPTVAGAVLLSYALRAPSPALREADYAGSVFALCAFAAGAACAAAAAGRLRPALGLAVCLAGAAVGGAYTLHIAYAGHIDVHVFQQEGAQALLRGENPYAQTYTDIYAGRAPFPVYPEAYPYPPQQLVLSTTAFAIAGDVRWGSLAATLLAALACYRLGRRRWPEPADARPLLVAVLVAFAPRGRMILERAWTEPWLLAALAWTLERGRTLAAGPLAGVALGLKQYTLVLAAPLLLLRPAPRAVGLAVLVLVTVAAPFAIWDPGQLVSDLRLEGAYAVRADSLSLAVPLSAHGLAPPFAAVVVGCLALGAVCARRLPPGPESTAQALAALVLLLFLLGPKAHLNYFGLALGLLALAAACPRAASVGPDPENG